LKVSTYEIAAALFIAHGNVAEAQRLLVSALGVDLRIGYVRRRVKEDPNLVTLVRELRLQYHFRHVGGHRVCGECGALFPQIADKSP
jgi:hypothetical protein